MRVIDWFSSHMSIFERSSSKKTSGDKWFTLKQEADDLVEALGKKLDTYWSEELKSKGREQSSLFRCLIRCFGPKLFFAASMEILAKCVFGITTAIILGYLINDIQFHLLEHSQSKLTFGWTSSESMVVYKSMVLLVSVCGNIFASQYYLYNANYLGMKCRLACTYLIYSKALRINLATLEGTTIAQIMNLITSDVSKFDQALYYLQYLYIAPLHALVVFLFLAILLIGPIPTLAGFSLVGLYLLLQVYTGRRYGLLQAEWTQRSDERVRLTSEMIFAINIIKMYAWELFFDKRITAMRYHELGAIKGILTIRAINLSLFYGACKLILMVVFVVFLLMGNKFDPIKVFAAITMTNSMRSYLTLNFPISIAQISEVSLSLERIRQFLTQDDLTTIPSLISGSRTPSRDPKLRQKLREKRRPILILPSGVVDATSAEASETVTTAGTPTSSDLIDPRSPATTCKVCAKYMASSKHPRHAIDKRFSIIFHDVSAAWPKLSATATGTGRSQAPSSIGTGESQPAGASVASQAVVEANPSHFSSTIFKNLTAHIKQQEFVMIVGQVGAGKSSLLMTLLNELPIRAGSIRVNGTMSYASQEPWLFAGTIRENITIFWHRKAGRDYNKLPSRLEQRYQNVLRICCLDKDLAKLPNGDLTMVGDRGASLSGGQKARVNLARALFYDADIYLLDDPLSAVDGAVARYIFDECFQTFLKRKTVLLVTHQVQFSTPAQKVLVLFDSPEFSYGPALKVLHRLFKQYNLNPEAAVASGTNEEQAVLPICVKDSGAAANDTEQDDKTRADSPIGPLGEVDSNSVSNLKSLASDDLNVSLSNSSFEIAEYQNLLQQQQQAQQQRQQTDSSLRYRHSKQQSKGLNSIKSTSSPTKRLAAEADLAAELAEPADCEAYRYYRAKAASLPVVAIFLITNLITQFLFNGTDYFLSKWSSPGARRVNSPVASSNNPQLNSTSLLSSQRNGNSFWTSTDPRFMCMVYFVIITLLLVTSFARNMIFYAAAHRASSVIHSETLTGVLYAPMSLFDQHSFGGILARFSNDLNALDDAVPQAAIEVIEICTNVIGIIVVTAIVSPWNLIPAVLILGVANHFRSASTNAILKLKQMEAIKRGHVYGQVVSALHGLTTIRVFRLETILDRRFQRTQNEHTKAWYSFLVAKYNLSQYIDYSCIAYFVILITMILVFVFMGLVDASMVGLLVSQVIVLPGPLQWGARQITEMQSHMTSVMRIRDYVTLRREQDVMSRPKFKLALTNWPQKGAISYKGITLSYVNGTDVLHDVTFDVGAGERIGIVGRTGAGKSSVISALFRMIDFRGNILIDGINTKHVTLHQLRSAISIIPQDPVLFSGSVRHNLDPFDEHSDEKLWAVLNSVHLKKLVAEMDGGLEAVVTEGGHNFSAGQKQLVCLGRAILRRNRVLVLDEATANVDPETDSFIQRTIRDLFTDCTVLTIAHRLQTIMDSDKVLVLEASRVKEFDEPHVLLQNPNSLLTAMVSNAGQSEAQNLTQMAESAFNQRRAKKSAPSKDTKSDVSSKQ